VPFADRISALLNGRARHEINRTTDFPGQFFAQGTQIKKRNRSVRAEGDQNVQVALIESVAARTGAKNLEPLDFGLQSAGASARLVCPSCPSSPASPLPMRQFIEGKRVQTSDAEKVSFYVTAIGLKFHR